MLEYYIVPVDVFVVLQSEGQTALHIASAEGDETLVKYFYGVRASASIIDNQGQLHSSIITNYLPVNATYLLLSLSCIYYARRIVNLHTNLKLDNVELILLKLTPTKIPSCHLDSPVFFWHIIGLWIKKLT